MNRTLLAVCASLSFTGCVGRQILAVEDAVSGGTSIVTTLDTKSYVLWGNARYVFWECAEEGGKLVCEKRCDVKDESGDVVKCQKITGLGL